MPSIESCLLLYSRFQWFRGVPFYLLFTFKEESINYNSHVLHNKLMSIRDQRWWSPWSNNCARRRYFSFNIQYCKNRNFCSSKNTQLSLCGCAGIFSVERCRAIFIFWVRQQFHSHEENFKKLLFTLNHINLKWMSI